MSTAFTAQLERAAPKGRYAFVSLGCPKNLVDSERMLGMLRLDGYELVDDPRGADFAVVNTCGFIEAARTESFARGESIAFAASVAFSSPTSSSAVRSQSQRAAWVYCSAASIADLRAS